MTSSCGRRFNDGMTTSWLMCDIRNGSEVFLTLPEFVERISRRALDLTVDDAGIKRSILSSIFISDCTMLLLKLLKKRIN